MTFCSLAWSVPLQSTKTNAPCPPLTPKCIYPTVWAAAAFCLPLPSWVLPLQTSGLELSPAGQGAGREGKAGVEQMLRVPSRNGGGLSSEAPWGLSTYPWQQEKPQPNPGTSAPGAPIPVTLPGAAHAAVPTVPPCSRMPRELPSPPAHGPGSARALPAPCAVPGGVWRGSKGQTLSLRRREGGHRAGERRWNGEAAGEVVQKAKGNKPFLAKGSNNTSELSGGFHLRLSEFLRNIS